MRHKKKILTEEQEIALRELKQEFGRFFDPKPVHAYYKEKEARMADKRAGYEKRRAIENIARRECISIELAEEFYSLSH